MYLISQNSELIANMDNISDVYISNREYEDDYGYITLWEIRAGYPATSDRLAKYGSNEKEKCVKQFEAFKRALLAEEKFFDFGKEIE